MPRLYTNTDCPLHGSEYCARLHMESCDTCTVRGRDEEEMQLLKQDLDAIAAMMPEEGIAALFLTNECVLCKGEERERAPGMRKPTLEMRSQGASRRAFSASSGRRVQGPSCRFNLLAVTLAANGI